MTRILACILLGAALSAGAPQAWAAAPAGCAGTPGSLRVSKIKPGQMALFLKATQDHEAWYKSHGYKGDQFMVWRVFPAQKGAPLTEDAAVTLHLDGKGDQPEGDAPWNAFLKEYNDSSTIETKYVVCVAAR